MPNNPMLGTKKQSGTTFVYEWMTVSEVYTKVKHFSAGLVMKDLIPEVDGEGSKWRFLGI